MNPSRPTSTKDLTASERQFVVLIQQLGFGRFEYLQIRNGEVLLNPWPVAVRDVKFGTPANTGSPAAATSELRSQVAEFFEYVRDVDAGEIRELQVRHGLPFSMEIELAGVRASAPKGVCRG